MKTLSLKNSSKATPNSGKVSKNSSILKLKKEDNMDSKSNKIKESPLRRGRSRNSPDKGITSPIALVTSLAASPIKRCKILIKEDNQKEYGDLQTNKIQETVASPTQKMEIDT